MFSQTAEGEAKFEAESRRASRYEADARRARQLEERVHSQENELNQIKVRLEEVELRHAAAADRLGAAMGARVRQRWVQRVLSGWRLASRGQSLLRVHSRQRAMSQHVAALRMWQQREWRRAFGAWATHTVRLRRAKVFVRRAFGRWVQRQSRGAWEEWTKFVLEARQQRVAKERDEALGKPQGHCWDLGCILPRVPATIRTAIAGIWVVSFFSKSVVQQ